MGLRVSASLTITNGSSTPVRDSKYYFPDGNTVLLAKNTLFKVRFATTASDQKTDILFYCQVHRFQLIRDQSAFEDMYSCHVDPSEELEGESDENPIRLQDDSVEEVRALIGYLYSLCVFLRSVNGLYLYYYYCLLQTTRGSNNFGQRRRLPQMLLPRTHRSQVPL
jgi:hypothetical protein